MRFVLLMLAIIGLTACTTPKMGTPADGSKFSKLEIGMSHAQAISLIGDSKDCQFKKPGLSLMPEITITCPYKNEGMLTFNKVSDLTSGVLIQIVVDTNIGDFQPIKR